jgi:hypothetical protein
MEYKTNYLALRYLEPGLYIPAHDPSYTNPTYDEAVKEAHYDLEHGTELSAIYKLVAVVTKDGVVNV